MAAQSSDEDNDERYLIHAPSSIMGGSNRVLKHGDTFAVFDPLGDIPRRGVAKHGVYHGGTRLLSHLRLRLGGERPLLLGSVVRENNVLLAVDCTNPDLILEDGTHVPYGTVHIHRVKFLWHDRCHERLRVSNYGERAVELPLSIEYGADFSDVFEIRGTKRDRRGTFARPQQTDQVVSLKYIGLDGIRRETRLKFSPAPSLFGGDEAVYRLRIDPHETKTLHLTCGFDAGAHRIDDSHFDDALREAQSLVEDHDKVTGTIHSSNPQFNGWIARARADLRMLVTETPKGPYPYAGVPWFSTPFGRDGILTALEYLWLYPQLARGVLRFLAEYQATEIDHVVDAQPGKILHETRMGEMANLREVPFGRYYGSVDATPLFVVLLGEYFRTTGDLTMVHNLWPHATAALDWIDRYGDVDGDGFVEYNRESKNGLIHQGWKDSNNSVFHGDGRDAKPPIALAEVQAYTYAAWNTAAELATALGEQDHAQRFEQRARDLQKRFDAAFWCDDLSIYALALDGDKKPCRIRTSNAGHCLFGGIATAKRAEALAQQLLSPDMFSGWGVRTLSSSDVRYSPIAYHNGSVWPHDNALLACGLSRYGLKSQALELFSAMFDASLSVDLKRLPELFCGFSRRPDEGPILYPVACAPQAWAAGAVFLMIQAILGLQVDGRNELVRFERPVLPPFLDWLRIDNLPVGSSRVTLQLHRHPEDVGIAVVERTGPVEIVVVK